MTQRETPSKYKVSCWEEKGVRACNRRNKSNRQHIHHRPVRPMRKRHHPHWRNSLRKSSTKLRSTSTCCAVLRLISLITNDEWVRSRPKGAQLLRALSLANFCLCSMI